MGPDLWVLFSIPSPTKHIVATGNSRDGDSVDNNPIIGINGWSHSVPNLLPITTRKWQGGIVLKGNIPATLLEVTVRAPVVSLAEVVRAVELAATTPVACTRWDGVQTPLTALGESANINVDSRDCDLSAVVEESDCVMVISKLKWQLVEALLSERRGCRAQRVVIATSMVCCNHPSNFNSLTNDPCGVDASWRQSGP